VKLLRRLPLLDASSCCIVYRLKVLDSIDISIQNNITTIIVIIMQSSIILSNGVRLVIPILSDSMRYGGRIYMRLLGAHDSIW
jgi:hypothetical protein